MEKMAIFVEGQTEQIFVKKLVEQIAGAHNVHIDSVQGFGGSAAYARHFIAIDASRPDPSKKYYVLITDCMNDSRVLSDIRDNYSNLTGQGFREIVGIRDVFPQSSTDIPTIRNDFVTLVPTVPIQPLLILAIMEIESWFIGEHTHFSRRHHTLTLAAVSAKIGYDPSTHDVQMISHPFSDLCSAYSIAGIGYTKKRNQVERIVSYLDYPSIYLELGVRIPDLKNLVGCIDRFLT
jgi:hypothetical protein